jgi:hypothetical protein
MHWAQPSRAYLCGRRRRAQLPVERVPGLEDDRVAGIDLEHRLDRLVPTVVAALRLLRERLRRIDLDHMLSRHETSSFGATRVAKATLFGRGGLRYGAAGGWSGACSASRFRRGRVSPNGP